MNHRCMKRARRALQIGRNSYRFGFCFAELSVPEMSGDGGPSGGPGRSDSEMSETEGGVPGPPCTREAVQREGLVSPYKLSPPGRDPVAYGRRFPPVNVRGARHRRVSHAVGAPERPAFRGAKGGRKRTKTVPTCRARRALQDGRVFSRKFGLLPVFRVLMTRRRRGATGARRPTVLGNVRRSGGKRPRPAAKPGSPCSGGRGLLSELPRSGGEALEGENEDRDGPFSKDDRPAVAFSPRGGAVVRRPTASLQVGLFEPRNKENEGNSSEKVSK